MDKDCFVWPEERGRWLRQYATSQTVAGSIPDEVIAFSSIFQILPAALGPGVDSASNRNEYRESSQGLKRSRRVRLISSPPYVSLLSRKCEILDV
jgi:hypothetical protein